MAVVAVMDRSPWAWEGWRREFPGLLILLLLPAILFLAVAGAAWQFHNPTANGSTAITHFSDMVHFRTLPQFQERP